jgi:hypothetical protein
VVQEEANRVHEGTAHWTEQLQGILCVDPLAGTHGECVAAFVGALYPLLIRKGFRFIFCGAYEALIGTILALLANLLCIVSDCKSAGGIRFNSELRWGRVN